MNCNPYNSKTRQKKQNKKPRHKKRCNLQSYNKPGCITPKYLT